MARVSYLWSAVEGTTDHAEKLPWRGKNVESRRSDVSPEVSFPEFPTWSGGV